MAREAQVLEQAKRVRSECVRPYFVAGDRVVVRWVFEFEWKTGKSMRMEELAYQRWEGDRIAEEHFFYDPVQLVRPFARPEDRDQDLLLEHAQRHEVGILHRSIQGRVSVGLTSSRGSMAVIVRATRERGLPSPRAARG